MKIEDIATGEIIIPDPLFQSFIHLICGSDKQQSVTESNKGQVESNRIKENQVKSKKRHLIFGTNNREHRAPTEMNLRTSLVTCVSFANLTLIDFWKN